METHAQLCTSCATALRRAPIAPCLSRSPPCSAAKVFQNLTARRHQRCLERALPKLTQQDACVHRDSNPSKPRTECEDVRWPKQPCPCMCPGICCGWPQQTARAIPTPHTHEGRWAARMVRRAAAAEQLTCHAATCETGAGAGPKSWAQVPSSQKVACQSCGRRRPGHRTERPHADLAAPMHCGRSIRKGNQGNRTPDLLHPKQKSYH